MTKINKGMTVLKLTGLYIILIALLTVISIIVDDQLNAYLYSSSYAVSYSIVNFLLKVLTAWIVFTFLTQYVRCAKELFINGRHIFYILSGIGLIVVILHFDQFYYLLPLDYSVCWDLNEVLAFVAAAQIAVGILKWKNIKVEL